MKAIEISLRNALDAMAIFEDGRWGKYGISQKGSTIYCIDEEYEDDEEAGQNFDDFVEMLSKQGLEFHFFEMEEM